MSGDAGCLFLLLLFGFGELLSATFIFGLQFGNAGGLFRTLFFLGTLLSGDAGCLFLLLLFGFGELLSATFIFGLQFGNARGLFRTLFFLGTLLSGDASGLFRTAFFVGALLRSFTLGTCLFLSFACRTFQEVQAVFRIQRQR